MTREEQRAEEEQEKRRRRELFEKVALVELRLRGDLDKKTEEREVVEDLLGGKKNISKRRFVVNELTATQVADIALTTAAIIKAADEFAREEPIP